MRSNPAKLFLVATELFGSGNSSSPSNTPEPFHGPRFPVMTIRDNVDAVHRLLTEELKLTHLRALIGFSMGAQQAFQWAVSYPDFTGPHCRNIGNSEDLPARRGAAGRTDRRAHSGSGVSEWRLCFSPKNGLAAFGMVWAGWLYSQEWWRKELWREGASPGTTFEQVMNGFRTRFSADANDYILQARTWEKHNVGGSPGFNGDVEKALRSIQVPLLYMPSETDLYFPINDARYEQAFIPHVSFMPIPSLWGHTAGAASNPADAKFLNENIGRFLAAGN